MIEVSVPYPVMLRLLQFEEGEDHLAAGLERAKGFGGVEIGLARIERGEDRPVKDHVQLCVGGDDRGRDVEQRVIGAASARQFVNQFLHNIWAGVIALPSKADRRLCRAAAPTARFIDVHAASKP